MFCCVENWRSSNFTLSDGREQETVAVRLRFRSQFKPGYLPFVIPPGLHALGLGPTIMSGRVFFFHFWHRRRFLAGIFFVPV
jgi:hypothetical protein